MVLLPTPDTMSWSAVELTGADFIPRAGHTSIILGSRLYILGGDASPGNNIRFPDNLPIFTEDYLFAMQYIDVGS